MKFERLHREILLPKIADDGITELCHEWLAELRASSQPLNYLAEKPLKNAAKQRKMAENMELGDFA